MKKICFLQSQGLQKKCYLLVDEQNHLYFQEIPLAEENVECLPACLIDRDIPNDPKDKKITLRDVDINEILSDKPGEYYFVISAHVCTNLSDILKIEDVNKILVENGNNQDEILENTKR